MEGPSAKRRAIRMTVAEDFCITAQACRASRCGGPNIILGVKKRGVASIEAKGHI